MPVLQQMHPDAGFHRRAPRPRLKVSPARVVLCTQDHPRGIEVDIRNLARALYDVGLEQDDETLLSRALCHLIDLDL